MVSKKQHTLEKADKTIDHGTIRKWVEERGGWPATIKSTASGEEAGILRIDFPGYSGEENLEPVSWEEWFDKFEENELAFLHQDRTHSGELSRFCKLVRR